MADFTTRITILTSKEVEDLYRLPKLTDEERALFFALDPVEWNVAKSHRSLTSKLFFILQLGYFKAKKLFFTPVRTDIQGDIEFIKNTHFPERSLPETLEINKITRWNQQKRILQVCHYQECDAQWRMKLQKRALQTVKIFSKPILGIFTQRPEKVHSSP